MGSRAWLVGCLVFSWCWSTQAQLRSTYGVPLSEREREAERAKEAARREELDEGRLSAAMLRSRIPDFQSNADAPWLGVSLSYGLRVPFQVSAFQVGVAATPLRWLRASLDYSFGFMVNPDTGAHVSQYGEALVGVRFWHAQSEVAVDLPLAHWRPRSKGVVRAWVPADHGLMVDAGVMTGGVALKRCTANCDAEPHTASKDFESAHHQLIYPLVGLRYPHFHRATSRQLGLTDPFYLQLYLHALLRPVNQPTEKLFFIDAEKHARKAPLGARIGGLLPMYKANLSVGYTPYPAFLYFEAQFVINFSAQRAPG